MTLLIFWAVPLFFGFFCLKRSFFRNWYRLLALLFAIYVGLGTAGLAAEWLTWIPGSLKPLRFTAAAVGIAAATMLILQKVCDTLWHLSDDFALPELTDRLASLVSGFFYGVATVSLLVFLLLNSPVRTHIAEAKEFEKAAVNRLVLLTGLIDYCSLQTIHSAENRKLYNARLLASKLQWDPVPPQKSSSQSTEKTTNEPLKETEKISRTTEKTIPSDPPQTAAQYNGKTAVTLPGKALQSAVKVRDQVQNNQNEAVLEASGNNGKTTKKSRKKEKGIIRNSEEITENSPVKKTAPGNALPPEALENLDEGEGGID